MKYRHKHHHICDDDDLYIFINSKEILTIKNIEDMNIIIDIEDNQSDLTTAVGNVKTAFTALQNSTLAGLSQALADLETAVNTLDAFQITFTASVPPVA